MTKSVSTSGTVAAQSTSNLNFTNSGSGSSRITKVNVTPGQQVKQGDVLAELDSTDAQSALASAKLSLGTAQAKLNQLLQGGTASTLASADQSLQRRRRTTTRLNARCRICRSPLTRRRSRRGSRP